MPIHGWINSDLIREALPYITLYGLSSLIIITFGLTAIISWKWRGLITLILIILFFFPLNQKPMKLDNNIIMVQANIPQNEKWEPEFIARNFNRYIDMSLNAVETNEPQIIIWPETAISQYLLENRSYLERFVSFLSNLPQDSILITGVLTYDDFGNHFNSLISYNQSGNIIARYDKHHLVPFGEYMPFGLDTITGFNNFQYGPPPKMIRLDSNIRFSFVPLICYESIFTHYSTITTDSGVLLNITNDSWFGNTAGPYQHFDHARFRAAENKTMVLRLSGNGISAIISQHGNILLSSRLNTQDIVKNN
jgi:apolipoprotein N-acyltransferase